MKKKDILKLRVDEENSIGSYLQELLITLLQEGESFNGRYPFGNSGWQYDLYKPLIENKLIGGDIDEDGDIAEIDYYQAGAMMDDLIYYIFKNKG